MKRVLAGAILVFLTACATIPQFEPMDVAQARMPDGYPAAVYEISSGQGDWDNVVVHVWTLGPSFETKTKDNKDPRTFMDVTWKISNHSKAAVQLDLAHTKMILPIRNGQPLVATPEPFDSPTVALGSESTLPLSFVLPRGTDADLIQAFDIDWSLTGNKQIYGQTTHFERQKSPNSVQPSFGIGIGIGR